MSRLAALKEYAYMKVLHEHDFPVPKPIDINRHCVVMQLLKATPLCQVRELGNPGQVYSKLMDLILKFASHGLIHCDFNEFNLLIDDEENVYIIDFPQMVSTSHLNAKEYFDRDVQCIRTFFLRKLGFDGVDYPVFERDVEKKVDLDTLVKASGFSKQQEEELAQYTSQVKETQGEEGSEDEDSDGNEDDEHGQDDEELAGKLAESLELDEGSASTSKPRKANKSKRATEASSSGAGKSSEPEAETVEQPLKIEGQNDGEQNPAGLKADDDTEKPKQKSSGDRNGKDEEAKDGNGDDNDNGNGNEEDEDGDNDNDEDDDDDDDGGVSEEIRHRVRRQVQRKFTSRNGSRNQTKNREKRRLKEDMKSSH